ncbi:phage tail protein [Pseudescherichia vulneris]|uniref:phage tail fiber protein n=1 Tax=Pseudescherichia vulneris TaxID=566 RepID=UPI00227C09C7|nr:phage tail protein [Pseudescherichia vulneris]WAH52499.1 phage tail protein [Pseudescherichia vulneris]
MIYNIGTIAGSGNTLTGTGTNFTAAGTLIRNGCTVIAMTSPPQVFQITGVNSATQLAVTPAVNPAIPAGTRYAILLSDSLSVDGLAQDIAETFGMYQRYMSGFADVMTGTGNVTITINGVAVTVPAQKSLAQKNSNGVLPLAQGGLEANNASDARNTLELRKGYPIAEANIFSDNNIDTVISRLRNKSLSTFQNTGVMSGEFYEIPTSAPTLWVGANDTWFLMSVHYFTRGIRVMSGYGASGVATTRLLLDNLTTTVDGNGFIKKASPVVRLTDDPRKMPFGFLEDFTLSGCAAVNHEAEGITAEKVSTGVYKVHGSLGFHTDGWTIEIPQDTNGNRLCFVETKIDAEGVITVSVFKRRFDIYTAMIVAGEPMDIPEGRWIDLRLEMPEDSVYNQKRKAAEAAMAAEQTALAEKDAESVDQADNPENQ